MLMRSSDIPGIIVLTFQLAIQRAGQFDFVLFLLGTEVNEPLVKLDDQSPMNLLNLADHEGLTPYSPEASQLETGGNLASGITMIPPIVGNKPLALCSTSIEHLLITCNCMFPCFFPHMM